MAAEAGEVDESLMFAQAAESYKTQADTVLKAATAPERTMMVCDVCGVFINSTDNEQRRKVSGALPGAPKCLPLCFLSTVPSAADLVT